MSASAIVRTVLGDIDPHTLGFCHAHDHVIIKETIGTIRNPDLLIDGVDEAIEEVTAFREAGGGALVDAMPLDAGRDPASLIEISRRTDVHVIATTGFHKPSYYEKLHWSNVVDIDRIADLVVAEVTEGMDRFSYGAPMIDRLPAKAGLVKVASEANLIGASTARLIEVASQVHLRTGVPILTHTEEGTMAIEQVERMTALGVPADSLLLSHLDRNHDPAYHAELAATGAFLIYDQPARAKYHTPETVIELMAAALDAGAGDRILVGLDLALRSYRTSYGGSPGLTFLIDTFVPLLRKMGFADEDIERICYSNPAAALSFIERV